jgi:hypothetical protein
VAHYTATEARRRFFRLLDAARRGERVELERDGVRFLLMAAEEASPPSGAAPLAVADPALLTGEWTWTADQAGQLQFAPVSAPGGAALAPVEPT